MNDQEKRKKLIELLKEESKHSGYQMLPPCLVEVMGEAPAGLVGDKRQDASRYDWFNCKWDSSVNSIIDIGANLGYFSFRALKDFNVKINAYEPYEPHAEAMSIIRELCGFNPEEVIISNKSVGMKEIDALPAADLLILLNVLQHAGEDFDSDMVLSIEGWRDYAIGYLKKLRNKTRLMFFQMGYTWKGYEGKLCQDNDIIDFTVKLLDEAGWHIRHCGIAKDISRPLYYEDYEVSISRHNAVFLPELNGFTGKVKKNIMNFLHPEYLGIYRFAQRPLCMCEVKN